MARDKKLSFAGGVCGLASGLFLCVSAVFSALYLRGNETDFAMGVGVGVLLFLMIAASVSDAAVGLGVGLYLFFATLAAIRNGSLSQDRALRWRNVAFLGLVFVLIFGLGFIGFFLGGCHVAIPVFCWLYFAAACAWRSFSDKPAARKNKS